MDVGKLFGFDEGTSNTGHGVVWYNDLSATNKEQGRVEQHCKILRMDEGR